MIKTFFLKQFFRLMVIMVGMFSLAYGAWSSVAEMKARGDTGGHVMEIGYSTDKGSPCLLLRDGTTEAVLFLKQSPTFFNEVKELIFEAIMGNKKVSFEYEAGPVDSPYEGHNYIKSVSVGN